MSITNDDFFLTQQTALIIGVDEVGRGALIGDVVAAAALFKTPIAAADWSFLADSKSLSEKKREQAAQQIKQQLNEQGLCYAIGRASPAEIDRLNIHHATLLAMQRAIIAVFTHWQDSGKQTTQPIDGIWVDGKFTPNLADTAIALLAKPPQLQAIVKGDAHFAPIACASILAKTERDADMRSLDKAYPDYGFARHKGYPTKAHLSALKSKPLLPQYRKGYAPIQSLLTDNLMHHHE